MKNAQPNFLTKGNVVWIVSPAKALPDNGIEEAVEILTSWGLQVKTGKHVYQKFGGFAGNDAKRIEDVQTAINDPQAKAIFFARGGYGSIRILHQLNWEKFNQNTKWLVGFSDITYFHLFANWQLGLASLHGTMPLEITHKPERKKAISQTKEFLFGGLNKLTFNGNTLNIVGEAKGQIIGGNLNILHGYLVGRNASDFFKDKILFIEDVGEELYALDRMLWNLKSSGVLLNLKALLVGGFTNIKDTNNWFPNQNIEDLILAIFEPLDIPLAFGIEAGHIKNNNPIPMGFNCEVEITKTLVKINFD
jgi:muramoyltetrapeptide carboxypeptidase